MGHPQYRACIRVLVNRVPVYDHKSLTDLMSESIVNWVLNIVNWALNIVYWALNIVTWALNIVYWVLNIVYWVLKVHVQDQN